MRLVDLLLTPRQPSNGRKAKETLWTSRQSPLGYTNTQNFDSMTIHNTLRYAALQDTSIRRQGIEQSSRSASRSTSSLSGLLRSTTSPGFLGYRSQSSVTSNPGNASAVTTELSRLLRKQDSNHLDSVKLEHDDPFGKDHPFLARTPESYADDSQELLTKDKNLNCNIWKSKVFPLKSSPSSASSFSSQSSIGGGDHVSNRRRVSLLSSDGSEMEPERFLPSMVDSDSYESLSSPLEEIEGFRWTEPTSSVGCLDYCNAEDTGERERFDFDNCQLFNFNFFGNSFDDSAFDSFDGNAFLMTYDNAEFCDVPLVTMTPDDVIRRESVMESVLMPKSNSSTNSGHVFQLNEVDWKCGDSTSPNGTTIRHWNEASSSSVGSVFQPVTCSPNGSVLYAPAPYASAGCTVRGETPQQSEVVKLLLQNRHQWAPPTEKIPTNQAATCRGSRKRAPTSSERNALRTKAPRHSTLPSLPSERRHSPASPLITKTPSATQTTIDREDHETSLERLITELMLLESANEISVTPNPSPVRVVSCTETGATSDELQVPSFPVSIAESFDAFPVFPASDADLFASMDFDPIYANECESLFALREGRGLENLDTFEAVVKSEPGIANSPPAPPSTWYRENLSQPQINGYGNQAALTARQHHPTQGEVRKPGPGTSVLENFLQTKLLLNSPKDESKPRQEAPVVDHDYCQNLGVLPFNIKSLPQTDVTDQAFFDKRRKYNECCLMRTSDYSALKSLLLDSNLTEEVKKEAELVRAKSRRKMSEKLTSTTINEPLRVCKYGKSADNAFLASQVRDEYSMTSPSDDLIRKELIQDRERSSESVTPEVRGSSGSQDQYLGPSISDLPDCHQVKYSETSQPSVVETNAERDVHNVAALDTCVTSDLDLTDGNNNAIFFESFEDFYNRSADSTLTVKRQNADSLNTNSMEKLFMMKCADSKLPSKSRFRRIIKKCNALTKKSGRLIARKGLLGWRMTRKHAWTTENPINDTQNVLL